MSRVPTLCTDEAKIVALLNAYTPAVEKHSWALSSERERQGFPMGGGYFRIGSGRAGANVARADWKRIIAEHGISMAEHWNASYARSLSRPRIFNHCWIKSRFGETKVERDQRGGIRSCDNAQAREFYAAQHRASLDQVVALIDARDLPSAIAKKKALRRAGEMF